MSILGVNNPYSKENTGSPFKALPKERAASPQKRSEAFTTTRSPEGFRKSSTGDHMTRKRKFVSYAELAPVPLNSPPELKEALDSYKKIGAGGIGYDFPQGDIGQPLI